MEPEGGKMQDYQSRAVEQQPTTRCLVFLSALRLELEDGLLPVLLTASVVTNTRWEERR